MKKLILAILITLNGLAFGEDLKMKPGLWEVKVTRQVVDGRDMTAQVASAQDRRNQAMANMSPEQRKQMEAMMGGKGMPAPSGAGGGNRICISPAMAAREAPAVDPQSRCEPAKLNRSGNTVAFEFKCSANGRTTVGKGKRTVSGDTVATSVDMTIIDAGGQHAMQRDSQMTYLGADCQGIQPVDELVKGAQAPAR